MKMRQLCEYPIPSSGLIQNASKATVDSSAASTFSDISDERYIIYPNKNYSPLSEVIFKTIQSFKCEFYTGRENIKANYGPIRRKRLRRNGNGGFGEKINSAA